MPGLAVFHGQSPGSSARSRGYPGLSVPPVRSPTRPGSRIVGGTFQRLSLFTNAETAVGYLGQYRENFGPGDVGRTTI
ncbi:hypothetical protein APA86_34190 [Pseudomonas aeruginosa]|nr:hypothetical protein APA86_34190 [Pseudomonas aeruginosa]